MRLDAIRARIRAHGATIAERHDALQAAVALILHEPEGSSPEILFIERATREGDPWSGQMALPGGRRDPEDPDLQTTASRETFEEVGVSLRAPLGRLDDFTGNRPRVPKIIVSPYVFELEERPRVRINHEVSSAVWIPVEWMLGSESSVQYAFDRGVTDETFPGIRYDRYTVWGLTYRILTNFFEVLGQELR